MRSSPISNPCALVSTSPNRMLPLMNVWLNLHIGLALVSTSGTSPLSGGKTLVLADSSNGYTVDFNKYIGGHAAETVSDQGLGYVAVMKLIQPFHHQGYHLFFDNFYSSLVLFRDLFDVARCAGNWDDIGEPLTIPGEHEEWQAVGKEKGKEKYALG